MRLKLVLPGAAVGFCAFMACVPVQAAVQHRLQVTTNYYVFGGTNHALMRAAMAEARPWKQRMAYDALTTWDIRSTYRYSRTNGQFRFGTIDVSTRVTITLPRWIPGKPVTRELVERWQKCLAGLIVHEHGHLQLAEAAAAEVTRRLDELAGFASAQDLRAAADGALNDTIEEYRRRERTYDRATGHGRTQGAVFPDIVKMDEPAPAPPTPRAFPPQRNVRR